MVVGKGRDLAKLSHCRECHTLSTFFRCSACEEGEYCWKCEGYSAPPGRQVMYPGSAEVAIPVHWFCKDHLRVLQGAFEAPMGMADYVRSAQAEEAAQMVSIFGSAECNFSLVPMPCNGYCVPTAIATAIAEEPEAMMGEFREFLRQQDGATCAAFDKFRRETSCEVRKKQLCEEGSNFLPALAVFLSRGQEHSVLISIWRIVNGRLERQSRAYPNHGLDNVFEKRIDLLQSNVVVPHFDLIKTRL